MDVIEELVAERDIRQLLAQYPHLADDNACDAWASLFAPDGALVLGPQRIQGHANLSQWLAKVQSGAKMRHLMLNQHITVESATAARVTVDMVLLGADQGRWVVTASPRYSDRLVKTEEGWKFAERVIDMRMPR